MAWSRKSKRKGERVVKRKLPDGTVKEYRYAAYVPKAKDTGDTLEALVSAYMSSPEWLALSSSTQAGRRSYLKPISKIGHIKASDLKRRDIIAIHDAMRVERGDGSAGGFLAAAKALFRWAIDKEWIEADPTLRIKAVSGGHHRAWTREEADKAEAGLPEPLRRVIVLARHTGQRRGDLIAMTWAQYDGSTIRVRQQKTKPGAKPVDLIIPVTAVLRSELDRWRAEKPAIGAATILTNSLGRPYVGQSLSHVLPIALQALGLPDDLNVHGLRKLAATELAQAGCTPHEIASITGHRTLQMVELYTKSVDQERLAGAAVVRLEALQRERLHETSQ